MGNQITYRNGRLQVMGTKIFFENKNLVIIREHEGITTTTIFGNEKTRQEIIYENAPTTECIICLECIGNDNDWATCVRCDIILHSECEKLYRKDKGYTECPHCRRIGCIGSSNVRLKLINDCGG